MYALIVGGGGCPPRYFLYDMSKEEAEDYTEGMDYRRRDLYEVMRFLANVIYKSNGGKKDLNITFDWDKDDNDETRDLNNEQVAEMKANATRLAAALNRRRAKKPGNAPQSTDGGGGDEVSAHEGETR